ncbi:MAG: hypothetical protein PHU07_00010 [Acidocella sp.]|nr:hypothetical protein [Acidocella sp.]
MSLITYGAESLADIANYQLDAERSLRLYFSQDNPNFTAIFAGYRTSDVEALLADMLSETDMRSGLILMARIEAAFRVDYKERSKKKDADALSVELRKLWKRKGRHVRLEDEIWNVWRDIDPPTKQIIGQLRSVFKFRHWLAHGRYWNIGNKYDFQTLYLLADAVLSDFPLYE